MGGDPCRQYRTAPNEWGICCGQWAWYALGQPCGVSGRKGQRARGRIRAPPIRVKTGALFTSLPRHMSALLTFKKKGYNRLGQSPARVRVPRGARFDKLDDVGRNGHPSASFHVDFASAYLCGTYPNSDIRNPGRRRFTRCHRVATATATAPCPARRRKPRGRRWVVGLVVQGGILG